MHPDTVYPDSVNCALKGIAAVDPRELVREALAGRNLPSNITVVSIGKAAETMAQGAIDVCGDRVSKGIVIAPMRNLSFPLTFSTFVGGHPIPNLEGREGARHIIEAVKPLGASDVLLCLISGGASALSMCPADGISLEDTQALTSQLLRSGATIDELNCVRKHVDLVKGGRLAKLASPATVITLILSDVIGDPLETIASGPTVPDPSTFAQAREILESRGLWSSIPSSVRQHIENGEGESPKPGDECFKTVSNEIVGNNTRAANAARSFAESLGYETLVVTTTLDGEARDRGVEIAREGLRLKKIRDGSGGSRPQCRIYAGETTVTVTGNGQGGRNQELVLAAAIELAGQASEVFEDVPGAAHGITVASVGTDGIDGPTDAAGAFAISSGATGSLIASESSELGLAPEDIGNVEDIMARIADMRACLNDNNAYHFFRKYGGLVMTGPTGTNVMDLTILTVE